MATSTPTGTKERKDGRRPLLVYLDADLIKALKKQALDEDVNVYELVERLIRLGQSKA